MEAEWQTGKGLYENRAIKKKFGVLQTTRVQKMKRNGKTEKSKGRFSNNRGKFIISDCQQEQETQARTEEKGWGNDGENGHHQRGVCRGEKTHVSGGINGTRRCGKEFAIKHTLLICWQAVPTRCQAKAGVRDSLCSACQTG